MKVSLNDGFEVEINETALDDYELFDMICDLQNGEIQKIPSLIRKILGVDGETKLKNHLRAENGVVKFTDMQNALNDIFSAPELKK